jgi:hypothetical protein
MIPIRFLHLLRCPLLNAVIAVGTARFFHRR